jgi:hypothetical protein
MKGKLDKELEKYLNKENNDPKMLQARIKFLEIQIKVWEEQYNMLQSFYVDEKTVAKYIQSEEFKAVRVKEKNEK